MEKVTFFILTFCAVFCGIKADRPKFSARVSDEFLYIGKSVKVIVTTTINEPGPLKYKFKVPFNVSAYMRILAYEMNVNDSLISITGSKTPNMTSSANNDNIIDIVTVDLGTVTPTGTVDIVMSFYAQLLNHPQLCSCDDLWIHIGAEFTNSSIWAHQHAVKRFAAIDMMPVLNASLKIPKMEADDTLIDGSTVSVHVRVTHNPHKTTAEVSNAEIVLYHPEYIVHSAMAKHNSNSVAVNVMSSSTTARVLGTPALGYTDFVDYQLNFTLDPRQSQAKGKIHKAHIALQVSFNYSSPLYGAPRTGTLKKPVSSVIKFYSKRASCETALGMASGTITNAMLRATSESQSGLAHNARLNGASAWVPASEMKTDDGEFIEVNLQGIKEITRIDIQGNFAHGSFVSLFRFFYSLDCVVWTMYKTKEGKEVLKGNTGPNKIAVVSFEPTIKAKCIRINPRAWKNQISLRFELYGCASSLSVPASNLNSRTYLVDVTTDYIYICDILIIRISGISSCHFSKDMKNFHDIDPNVLNINFINPATKKIYGMGLKNTHYVCSATSDSGQCSLISKNSYDAAKAESGVVLAKVANRITLTDDPNSWKPNAADTFDMQNSKKIGASPKGIYYWDGSSWLPKAMMPAFFDY